MSDIKGLCMLDMTHEGFDMNAFDNRRFMYCPEHGILIFGKDGYMDGSHAAEHGETGCRIAFDKFVRGWVGNGKGYPNGVIHFAPNVPKECAWYFDKAFQTLEMFAVNGMKPGCIIRGFGDVWEQRYDILMARAS